MSLYIDKKPRNAKHDLLVGKTEDKNVYWSNDKDSGADKIVGLSNFKPVAIKQPNQIFSAFITGSSGSGKSTYASMLCESLLKSNKATIKDVFFITAQTQEDPAFKSIREVTRKVKRRVKYNRYEEVEESIFQPLDINNQNLYNMDIGLLRDSIIIFDDYEALDATLEKLMNLFVKKIMNMGRKLNINPIVIRHKLQNRDKTAEILMEAQHVITFPNTNRRDTVRFFSDYMSFNNQEIHDLRKINTRGLYVRKVVPNFILYDTGIELI